MRHLQQHVSRSAADAALHAGAASAAVGALAGLAAGVGWYGTRRRRSSRPAESGPPARAVRRDWPDGTHDFAAFGLSADATQRWVLRDAAYWRRGPVRPSYSFVRVSAADFYRHRRTLRCVSTACPQPTVVASPGAVQVAR